MLLGTEVHADYRSIYGDVNGDHATLWASTNFAGAILSFSFRGTEYIDTNDYGRLLQSAAFFDDLTECYGPTEAGSRNGFQSQLLSWSNAGNVLTTSTQMAFWLAPGQSSGSNSCPPGVVAQNTTLMSQIVHHKEVSFGYAGLPNVLQYKVRYDVPEEHTSVMFEVVSGYLKPYFNQFFIFDPASSNVQKAQLNSCGQDQCLGQSNPVFISTADGFHAMGVYAPGADHYALFDLRTHSNSTKWNCAFGERPTAPQKVFGQYNYECLVVFGTVSEVVSALRTLTSGGTNNLIPLYSFWHGASSNQFVTANYSEAAYGGFHFQGTAFRMFSAPQDGGMVALYRCFDRRTNNHLVSTAPNCEGMSVEGTYGYVSSYPRPGYEPIYRFYSPYYLDHYVTSNVSELHALGIYHSYHLEGVLGYAPTCNPGQC